MMTLTGIDLQSKIARFFSFKIVGEKKFHPYEVFVKV